MYALTPYLEFSSQRMHAIRVVLIFRNTQPAEIDTMAFAV